MRTRRSFMAGYRTLLQRIHRDDGTTLIELMVGMVLMTIFMTMFTGAILMMNNAMNTSQAINLTASQLNVAFLRLDTIVRSSASIGPPGVGTSGDWYVELRTTYTGTVVCTQLRVDITAQQLQQRTWTVANAVATTPSTWAPIASGISNGAAAGGPTTQPFYLQLPQPNALYQQLTVNLTAPSGSGPSSSTSSSAFTLTAMNSVFPVPTSPICQEQGRP